jgi:hypothetical protein
VFYAAIVMGLWLVLALPLSVLVGRSIAKGSTDGPPVRVEDGLATGTVNVPAQRRPAGQPVTGDVRARAAG